MSASKLKEDLKNCLITFDRCVVLTELLDDYDLTYDVVNTVVEEHVKQQENKGELKYEKRYLVHGVRDQGDNKKEIFKIVEEQKLKEWMEKLKDAESTLYSVEVAGGAKAAAAVFKPLKVKQGVKLKDRKGVKSSDCNSATAENTKISGASISQKELKMETKNSVQELPAKKSNKDMSTATNKQETPVKKPPPKVESSPTTKKPVDKKAATSKKGGINNFFAPAAANKKVDSESKDSKASLKPPTPKKMEDFFKKQAEKPKTVKETITTAANKSIQLFDAEDEEKDERDEVSSDEEEKIEALKRDIISSDVEMDASEETDNKATTSAKRRRILDSDDEEENPPVKQEKLEMEEDIKEEEVAEPETYLDEEGFVITKKPKQKTSVAKTTAIKTTPAVTLKTSPKENKKASSGTSKDKKGAGNSTAKTKQAGIMSFFSKK